MEKALHMECGLFLTSLIEASSGTSTSFLSFGVFTVNLIFCGSFDSAMLKESPQIVTISDKISKIKFTDRFQNLFESFTLYRLLD